MALAVQDYKDCKGIVVIPAGSFVSADEAPSLDPQGLAEDYDEAMKKFKDLATASREQAQHAKLPERHDVLMYDYHLKMALYHRIRYSKARETREDR